MDSNNKTNLSLKFSLLDGVFASIMLGLTQDYFTPLLLLFNASAKQIGMLTAFPNFFASFIQLKSADITEKFKSRKKIIAVFVFLQALMIIPILIIIYYKIMNPYIFIFFIILFISFGAFANPPWGSLMSDLVIESKRGEYFGWRNRLLGFVIIISIFSAGYILHVMKNINIFFGFIIIFFMAFICRIISGYFITKMYEPNFEHKKEDYFNLVDFLKRIKEGNFGKFVLCISFMSFSANICSPFFAVFMLNDLSFSYLTFTFVSVTANIFIYLFFKRWGRHADIIGNIKVIKFTVPLIGILPLLWIVNQHPLYLFFVQACAGFLWSGFNLCTLNFVFDSVSPEKRIRCISYFNFFNGLGICFGSILGGLILKNLPVFLGYKMFSLFIISSTFRLLTGIFLLKNLKEIRTNIKKISNKQLFFSMINIINPPLIPIFKNGK